MREKKVFVLSEKIGADGGVLFREYDEAVAFAEISDWDDELARFVTALIFFLLLLLGLGFKVRASHAVWLPHLTSQDELNAQLMLAPSFEPCRSLAIGLQLFLDIGAEKGLESIAACWLAKAAARIGTNNFGVVEARKIFLLREGLSLGEGTVHG